MMEEDKQPSVVQVKALLVFGLSLPEPLPLDWENDPDFRDAPTEMTNGE